MYEKNIIFMSALEKCGHLESCILKTMRSQDECYLFEILIPLKVYSSKRSSKYKYTRCITLQCNWLIISCRLLEPGKVTAD